MQQLLALATETIVQLGGRYIRLSSVVQIGIVVLLASLVKYLVELRSVY